MHRHDDLYRWIVRSTTDGIWIFDAQGRTTYANDRLGEILGRAPEEMDGLSAFDTLDDVGREQFREHLAELESPGTGTDNVECSLLRGDGTRIWALISYTPLLDDAGARQGWLHRVTELTDRKLLLDQVRASQQQLAEAQSIAKVGSWGWDIAANVVTWSDELYRMYNLEPQEFEGSYEGFLSYIHPQDRPMVEATISGAFAGANAFEFDARIIKHGGDQGSVRGRGRVTRDDNGVPVRMGGTAHDITETVRAAEALTEASDRLAVLQTMTAAANQAATLAEAVDIAMAELARHTGWTARAAYTVSDTGTCRGLPLASLPASATRAPGPRVQEVVARGVTSWGEEIDRELGTTGALAVPVVADGRVVAVLEFVGEALPDPMPSVLETVNQVASQLARVAERERAAQDLARARDAAMEASRMKSEFLTTMSHEIRTPLNGVLGLSELLLRTDLDEQQKRLAGGVDQAGRVLLALITDILDLSKIEAGKLELEEFDFDVREAVGRAACLLSASARRKNIELTVACHPDVPAVLRGDQVRFGQVVTNLVSNAVKFTVSGEVSVRVTRVAHTEDGRTTLRVEVADTGVGIAPETREILFTPFTQADSSTTREHGGTGLGLSISRRLAHALGGEIGVSSEIGNGSTFWFTAAFRPPDEDAQDAGSASSLSGLHVLVVDDHETTRLILRDQLLTWDVSADLAASAEDALVMVAESALSGQPYAAVLIDLAMPGTDGLGLAEAIRSDLSAHELPLVLFAPAADVAAEQLSRLGIHSCLDKPVLDRALRDTLARIVDGAPHTQEPEVRLPVAKAQGVVLVVEDNPLNQIVATGILESLGYQVVIAHDGIEAVEQLTSQHEYVAVLMDCQMPRLDGYDATRAIRAHEGSSDRVPIIAMTAGAVSGERDRCLGAGMDDFLSKPVSMDLLTSALERWTSVRRSSVAQPEADAGVETEGVIDKDRLDMLTSLKPGDPRMLSRFVDSFLHSTPRDHAEILRAVATEDPRALVETAHRLKGGALNLGVPHVADVCQRLEDAGDDGDLLHATALSRALTVEVERATEALRRIRARLDEQPASLVSAREEDR